MLFNRRSQVALGLLRWWELKRIALNWQLALLLVLECVLGISITDYYEPELVVLLFALGVVVNFCYLIVELGLFFGYRLRLFAAIVRKGAFSVTRNVLFLLACAVVVAYFILATG